jgi:S-formylglutathione hydrolase FrmB
MFGMWALALGGLVAAEVGPVRPEAACEAVEAVGSIDGREVRGAVRVCVPTPCQVKGASCALVIALHGWDHAPATFVEEARLGALAASHQLVVAIPETGRSVFESAFYPETRGRWKKAPGARWVGEVVLPWLRANLEVDASPRETAILGYSTGGRGAFVVAQRYPQFGFVGSVSGTFDLMSLAPRTGEHRIHAAVFGPRRRHAGRWRHEDVIASGLLGRLAGVHVYAAHGDADAVVPAGQLRALEAALASIATASAQLVTVKGGGHDWPLWNAHWGPMFEAFARARRPR